MFLIVILIVMISRIEFLYKHYNIEKRIKEKVKLNNKKIKYIIKQKEKGEGTSIKYIIII